MLNEANGFFENWVYVFDPVDEDTVDKFWNVIILLNGIVLIFWMVKNT